MKTQITSAIAAATIAMTGFTATPAKALTDEEAFALVAGAVVLAILANSGAAAPAPVPAPVTFSTGPLTIKQTFAADFDHGSIGAAGADMWFQAVNPTHRYLKPINGARLALGDGSNRGFSGCSTASYSSNRINLNHVPVGTYVCMKTGAGRISQFRMNAILGGAVKKLKIGYTTWQ